MNKTYRSVWSEARGTYVAVADNVKTRGKRTSGTRLMARSALAMAMVGAMSAAQATISVEDSANPAIWDGNEIVFSNGTGRIVFEQGGAITGLSDAALNASSTDAVTGRQLYAVDEKAQWAQDAVTALDERAVQFNAAKTAIDAQDAKITNLQGGALTANSKEAVTGGQLFTTNQDIDTINQRLANLGLSGASDTYAGVKYFRASSDKADAAAVGPDSVAVGPEASASGASSIAVGDGASTQSTAEAAVAVGRGATAAGSRAVALGDGASVDSEFVVDAIAVGTGARVSGNTSSQATAIGANAQASAAGATALGAGASASGTASAALGAARAQGGNSLALGNDAQAHATNDIAMGTGAGLGTFGTSAEDRTSHIAIGTRAGQNVEGNQTIALGFEAGSNVAGDYNIGIGAQAGSGVDGDRNVAIGYQANFAVGQADHATAVGSGTVAGSDAVALGYQANAQSVGSVALGTNSNVTSGQGVAIGRNAYSDGAGVALGSDSVALVSDAANAGYLTGSTFVGGSVVSVGNTATGARRRIVNVEDGSGAYDAVNVRQLRGAQQSVANLVGGGVAVNADGTFGPITVRDTNDVEHQYSTVVDALGAVTSGQIEVLPADAARYNADGTLNVAAATQNGEAVNLQQLNDTIDANASRYYSVNSTLPGNRDNTKATGSNAMAIGPEANATGDASMAMGYKASALANEALALGHNTNALAAGATVLGTNSFAYGESGVAVGNEARSQGENSIVVGTRAQADAKDPNQSVDNSIVIGTSAESTADNGIAVGQDALASDVRGIAQGYAAESSARDATAIGSNARASGVNASASGTRAIASGASALASGTEALAYADNGIALGRGAQAGKASPLPTEQADNVDAIAIGSGALADAKNATALGRSARATGVQSLAIGDGSAADGTDAQAVGSANQVAASNGGAFGNRNAIGASAEGSRVVGNDNTLGAADAFILGNQSSVTAAGGVALGSGSASTTGANVAGYVSNGSAGKSAVDATIGTTGAVAVGGNGVRRQITGLAAGTNDSDAVNVAQLKATGWNIRTDGDAATHVSTGHGDTVDIGLAGGENNLIVTRTSENGSTVIDYALNKNLDLGDTGSVKTGGTRVDNAGVSVGSNVALGNTGLVIAGGPSVTADGISAGGKRIINVAPGVNGTDGVNVSQLTEQEQDLTDKGFGLAAGDGNTVQKKLGEAVDVVGADANVVTQVADGKLQIALGDSIRIASDLTVGGTTNLGGNTLVVRQGDIAIGGNTSVSMGGNQVHNVAAGTSATDAVNLGQLTELADKPLTFSADYGANLDRKLGQEVGINGADSNISTTTTQDGVQIALARNLDLGDTGSIRTGDTSVNSTGVSVGPNVVLGNTGLVIAGGPSVTMGGINAGGKTVTNVAPGVDGTDAVNVDQLKSVSDVANQGWNLTAQGGNLSSVAPGATVDLASGDGNIVITKGVNDADVKFALAEDLTVSNVVVNNDLSVGGTTNLGGGTLVVRQGEVTVGGNTTVNMGGNRITNIARGEDGGDAVNVDQLDELANRPLAFTADSGDAVERTLGQAIAFNGADANITTQTTADGVQIALSRNLDLGADGSIRLGDATLAGSGLTIAGGPSITRGGIDAGGKSVVNVAAGVDDLDAVNVSQLKDVETVARSGWNLSVNGDAGADQSQVKPGDVVDFSNDDGNVRIAKEGNDVKLNLNPDLVVDSVTAGDTTLNHDGVMVGDEVTLTASGLGVGDNILLGSDGLRAGNVIISASSGINAGGYKITNVAAGTDDTDAVNVSQLKDVQQNVDNLGDRAVKYDGAAGDPKNTITLEGDTSADGGKTGGTRITNVAQGEISATSTDAVNGAQLHEQGSQVAGALGGNSTYVDGKLVTELNVGDKTYGNVNDALNGVNNDLTDKIDNVEQIANAGWQIEANGEGASKVAPGAKVEFVNGDNIQISHQTGADGNSTIKVSTSQDITVNSVTAQEVKAGKVQAKEVAIENGPTINQNGIDMSGKQIVNVGAGTASTDAVNLGQLEAATNGMQNQVNQVRGDLRRLDNKLSAGVAAAMATAGLPQAYLPGKSMASLAGASYSGESAFAVGVSTISDSGKWVLKLSGNGNSRGDFGGAVGVGYQW